jgi:hypothetical protein
VRVVLVPPGSRHEYSDGDRRGQLDALNDGCSRLAEVLARHGRRDRARRYTAFAEAAATTLGAEVFTSDELQALALAVLQYTRDWPKLDSRGVDTRQRGWQEDANRLIVDIRDVCGELFALGTIGSA